MRAWDRARGIARQLCRGPLSLADPSRMVNVQSFPHSCFPPNVYAVSGVTRTREGSPWPTLIQFAMGGGRGGIAGGTRVMHWKFVWHMFLGGVAES